MRRGKHPWPIIRLGELAEFRNGVNYNKSSFGTGIKVIGVSDFQNHVTASFGQLEEINPEGVVRKEHLLRDGDILFVRSNGNRDLIGRSLFVTGLREDITHSAFSIRLRFTSPRCYSRFYAYLFRSTLIRQALSMFGGGTNISNLNQGILERLEVPVPRKPTQERIASILAAYDDLIENNTRRIKILEDMAQMLYREWFVNFRFPGHENVRMVESELGPIPEGWTVRNLFDVAHVTYGFPFKSKLFTAGGDGIPVIRIRDITSDFSNTFTTETADSKYIIKNGDLLVGMDGDFHMGKWAGGHAYLNQRVVRFRPKTELSPYFLFLALEAPINHFDSTIVGTTVAHLSDRDLRSTNLLIPGDDMQKRTSDIFNPLFGLEITLKLKTANLRSTRDFLLPKLISGEIPVEAAENVAVEAAVTTV